MYAISETLRQAINERQRQRVLLEFDSGATFSNEDISMRDGVALLAPFNGEKELTVGLTPCAELRFTMLNNVRQVQNFEFGRFRAWLGAEIVNGTPLPGAKTATYTERGRQALYEFAPLGVFVAKRPDVVMLDMIDVEANDQMTYFERIMPDAETLGLEFGQGHTVTLLDFVEAMIDYVNSEEELTDLITLKSEEFTNADLVITAYPKDYANKTMREVLAWVAEAAGSIARFTRDGLLELAWFAGTQGTFTPHNYTKYVPCWYDVAQIDSLHVRNQDETGESKVGSTDNNAYVIQGNPFLS